MDGITGHVSIMTDDDTYLNYNKLDKLRHDLHCLKVAGFSGPFNSMYEDRKLKISDVERRIMLEERKMKLEQLALL